MLDPMEILMNARFEDVVQRDLSKRERKLRRKMKISQQEMASRSGVSLGSIKRFEQTGEISQVILACVVAGFVGLSITLGIQKNMKAISSRFNQVADGDLRTEVKAYGKDEFQDLAQVANNMIRNNRNLVKGLYKTIQVLEQSTGQVDDASGDINTCSQDITRAINEINIGMDKQAEHAQECAVKTNTLSERIKEVRGRVDHTQALADKTERMIGQGAEIVGVLGDKAQETWEVTQKVGDSITQLQSESQAINEFVETISSISKQTNLLSDRKSVV